MEAAKAASIFFRRKYFGSWFPYYFQGGSDIMVRFKAYELMGGDQDELLLGRSFGPASA